MTSGDHHAGAQRDPIDADDDLYSALALREGPWFMQGEDGELRPALMESR